jgi:DNA modification methylase
VSMVRYGGRLRQDMMQQNETLVPWVALPEFFILPMTKDGDAVLDPFMASGTTALSARGLGRRYVGVELSENYLWASVERLARTPLSNR